MEPPKPAAPTTSTGNSTQTKPRSGGSVNEANEAQARCLRPFSRRLDRPPFAPVFDLILPPYSHGFAAVLPPWAAVVYRNICHWLAPFCHRFAIVLSTILPPLLPSFPDHMPPSFTTKFAIGWHCFATVSTSCRCRLCPPCCDRLSPFPHRLPTCWHRSRPFCHRFATVLLSYSPPFATGLSPCAAVVGRYFFHWLPALRRCIRQRHFRWFSAAAFGHRVATVFVAV